MYWIIVLKEGNETRPYQRPWRDEPARFSTQVFAQYIASVLKEGVRSQGVEINSVVGVIPHAR